MCRRLLAVALLLALAAPAPAGVIANYNSETYDRFYPSFPTPNSSSAFVASGINLSGIGWVGDPKTSVTLISPQHILGAAHAGFGSQVQFRGSDGVVRSYAVTSSVAIPGPAGTSDLLLGTLNANEALPTSHGVRYFGVAGLTAAQAVGLPILVSGQNAAYSASPHLGTNVIDDVILANTTRAIKFGWTDGVPGEIYLISGDSGGPVFVRAHGDLALVGVNYAISRTTLDPQPGDFSVSSFVPEYIDELNARMGDYRVTVVPVPEPAGLLVVAGLVVIGLVRRRRAV
jgi:hypothetical protein